ncbi:MAG: type IV pilus twitching motility protein PilT [Pseudomonadota bacterium]|nr:type IV pilus twitching motility protein PilT [Pseudomonadota bacterium]
MKLNNLLTLAVDRGASDLHLKVGIVPVIRKHGILRPLDPSMEAVNQDMMSAITDQLLSAPQKETLEREGYVDLGYGISGLGRFRVNIFKQRGTLRLVIRNIPFDVPDIDNLNLPPIIKKLALETERGLILVTGMTGSGKSTTLAAMIDYVNKHRNRHIITIEDPIEFLIKDQKCIISQVELGSDAPTYPKALRAALRQDPDIILIGEMRDLDTIDTAITAAETGHLVLSTLHTSDAVETINRILAAYPSHQQQQIRYQLSSVITAIISQRMIMKTDEQGFVPAIEVLINTSRIKELILNGARTKEIFNSIEEGKSAYGMQSFDQSLLELVHQKIVTFEEAMASATNPKDFALRHSGVKGASTQVWDPKSDRAAGKKIWDDIQELELQTNVSHIQKSSKFPTRSPPKPPGKK